MATKSKSIARKKPPSGGLTDRQAMQLLQKIKKSPPLASEQDAFELDRSFREDCNGVMRRMILVMLTKSGRELVENVGKDRAFAVALADVYQHTRGCIERHEALMDLLKAAELRMMIALCTRGDMQQVIDESAASTPQSEGHA